MFIYHLNQKGFKKFEKDINEKIQEADYITITLETTVSKLSIDITKKEIKESNLKVYVRYNEGGFSYIDFDLNLSHIFLSNININFDLREILYYYDNYDSIEHLHIIHLNNGVIKFEYHNKLDETIVKANMED
ncbi:MAG: hypothetical protein J6D47_12330 [Peptostreptococcaceae bacterium]|nr:hypothetical protein [Peptostreptococcaceae bacterium]